jgi:hypothetical protein
MSLVEVETPLHNVLTIGSCGTLLVLYLIQILFFLILHLYIHLDLHAMRCIEVHDYTVRGYTVVVHCYMVVVPGLNEVQFVLSSFLLAPYKYINLFLSSAPSSYNLYHHEPHTCRNCNMNFWVLSYTYASLENGMGHAHVFYKSRTMVLLLEKDLVLLFPCTA